MKTLYFDCSMGAAGDMLAAALLELLPEPDVFVAELNSLGIPKAAISRSQSVKCGITGTHFSVKISGVDEDDYSHLHHKNENNNHVEHHGHHHSRMNDIEQIISVLPVSEQVKENVIGVYRLIAEAESCVHGSTVSEVHFHEVGALDAVADIVSVCLLMEKLAPDRVVVSPICIGSGQVECCHGILPVPAPATALILRGMPTFGGTVVGEMCTPTGAALLKHFATSFGTMPGMCFGAIGYGMGKREYGIANCVRAFLGESKGVNDVVVELKCNLDDMTPEAVGFAQEFLFEKGALDVYTVPIGMKKSRPGTQLCCMCREKDKEKMVSMIFKHTTTLGIRISRDERCTMERETSVLQTVYGSVRIKKAVYGDVEKLKPEYEDLVRITREENLTLAEAAALTDKK